MSSVSLCFTDHWIPSPPAGVRNGLSPPGLSRVSFGILRKPMRSSLELLVAPNRCSERDQSEVDSTPVGDTHESSVDSSGSGKGDSKQSVKPFSSNELLQKLRRYGVAGVLSYGLLNTIYYLTTFLLVWFYFAPAPGRMGYAAAVERFLKIMAMVWAGSQVTKIIRAGGALALAPFVDRGLSWFTIKFKFESQGKAFAAIAGLCFTLAVLLFFSLTLLSA
ncbi:uncharacterized protein [Typha latifolia]|uniref:uncharacterized protein n=1 Tax=Typha latifolia TaxID=4733 RepID=UPI003C2CE5E7